jgi:uncharacterized protein
MLGLAPVLVVALHTGAEGSGAAAPPAAGGAPAEAASRCDRGDGEACNRLALAYHDGRGVPQDLPRAQTYYGKACDAGVGAGCQNLGDLHGQLGAAAKARAAWGKAAEIYRRACDGGALELCVNLGTLLEDGRLAAEGSAPGSDALKRDLLAAVALYERACSGGDTGGCVNLASLYTDGRGVSKDEARARSLLTRGCDRLRQARDERAKNEAADACANLALLVQVKHPQKSVPFHMKACKAGRVGACGNLGVLLSHCKKPDWKAANALFLMGCDGGDPQSCWNLALSVDAGFGVRRDPAEAQSLRDRACKMGLRRACAE